MRWKEPTINWSITACITRRCFAMRERWGVTLFCQWITPTFHIKTNDNLSAWTSEIYSWDKYRTGTVHLSVPIEMTRRDYIIRHDVSWRRPIHTLMGFIVNFPKRRRPYYHGQNDFVAISETGDSNLLNIGLLVWLWKHCWAIYLPHSIISHFGRYSRVVLAVRIILNQLPLSEAHSGCILWYFVGPASIGPSTSV